MPNWNRRERGVMTDEEEGYYDSGDYDALSCAEFDGLPGRGVRDVEDLTMLSGLKAEHEENRKD